MQTHAAAARLDARQLRNLVLFVAVAGALTALLLSNRALSSAIPQGAAPLLVIAGVVVGALTLRFSAAGVPILIVFVYLNLSEALVRYHNFPSVLQLLVIGLAFAAWLKRDTDPLGPLLGQWITIALASYLLFTLTSTIWARDGEIADGRIVDLYKAAALFALATLLMRTRRRILHGVRAVVIAAAVIGALVAFQMATGLHENEFFGLARVKAGAHLAGDIFQARPSGPIGDPNFFAQALLIPLPLAVVLGLTARSRWKRALWTGGAALILLALGLTYSRGALIVLPIAGIMLARALKVGWRRIAATAAAIALLGALIMPGMVVDRLSSLTQILPIDHQPLHRDSSFDERRIFMRVAWAMFTDLPMTGVGAGNYGVRYEDYSGLTSSEVRQWDDLSDVHFAHNMFLEVAAEAGIPGLLLLMAMLGACWIALRRSEKAFAMMDDPQMSRIAGALRVALVGFALTGLFLHLALPRHLFLIFAFAASLERLAKREEIYGQSFAVEVRTQ